MVEIIKGEAGGLEKREWDEETKKRLNADVKTLLELSAKLHSEGVDNIVIVGNKLNMQGRMYYLVAAVAMALSGLLDMDQVRHSHARKQLLEIMVEALNVFSDKRLGEFVAMVNETYGGWLRSPLKDMNIVTSEGGQADA